MPSRRLKFTVLICTIVAILAGLWLAASSAVPPAGRVTGGILAVAAGFISVYIVIHGLKYERTHQRLARKAKEVQALKKEGRPVQVGQVPADGELGIAPESRLQHETRGKVPPDQKPVPDANERFDIDERLP